MSKYEFETKSKMGFSEGVFKACPTILKTWDENLVETKKFFKENGILEERGNQFQENKELSTKDVLVQGESLKVSKQMISSLEDTMKERAKKICQKLIIRDQRVYFDVRVEQDHLHGGDIPRMTVSSGKDVQIPCYDILGEMPMNKNILFTMHVVDSLVNPEVNESSDFVSTISFPLCIAEFQTLIRPHPLQTHLDFIDLHRGSFGIIAKYRFTMSLEDSFEIFGENAVYTMARLTKYQVDVIRNIFSSSSRFSPRKSYVHFVVLLDGVHESPFSKSQSRDDEFVYFSKSNPGRHEFMSEVRKIQKNAEKYDSKGSNSCFFAFFTGSMPRGDFKFVHFRVMSDKAHQLYGFSEVMPKTTLDSSLNQHIQYLECILVGGKFRHVYRGTRKHDARYYFTQSKNKRYLNQHEKTKIKLKPSRFVVL